MWHAKRFIKKGSRIFIMSALIVLGAHCVGHTEDLPHLSLESALLFSLYESTDIKIAHEKSVQAGYSVEEARAKFLPEVQMFVESGVQYNNPGSTDITPEYGGLGIMENMVDVNLTLRQMLFDDTKVAEVLMRKQQGQSTLIEGGLVEQDVIVQTLEAYLDVLSTQKSAYAAAEMLVNIRELVDRIEAAYEAGGESKAKVDFSKARLALAKSKYQRGISSYHDALSQLELLTGPLPEFLAVNPTELDVDLLGVEDYKKLAENHNGDLDLVNSNLEATEFDYKKQEAGYFPKMSFVVEAGNSYDKGGDVGWTHDASATVQIQYDIFKGFERRAAKNRIASKKREISLEKEQLLKDINKEVKANYFEVQSIEESVETKEAEIESYLSLRKIALDSEIQGEVDLFQSIENEENIYDALSQIHQLQSDRYKKTYALLKTVGILKKEEFCESC